jgi:hypothetical protein
MATTHSLIEKFVKLHKTHRNIMDQESALLDSHMNARPSQAAVELAVIEIEYEKFKKYNCDVIVASQ